MNDMTIEVLPGRFAVCRLDAKAEPPSWARGDFVSITRTPEELSVVCAAVHVPAQIPASRDWRCLKVQGPLDLTMIGVVANLAGTLAAASISVFVVATYDTDYLLVMARDLEGAIASLSAAGHRVTPGPG